MITLLELVTSLDWGNLVDEINRMCKGRLKDKNADIIEEALNICPVAGLKQVKDNVKHIGVQAYCVALIQNREDS